MKAAICHETDRPVVVEEVSLEGPRRGEVRLRLVAAGVCHSDLSVVNGTIPARLPLVLGHEGAGIVEEVGEAVTHVRRGDRVVLAWVTPCGECFFCRGSQPQLCEVGSRINATNRMPDGSSRLRWNGEEVNVYSAVSTMAQEAVVPARAAIKLPDAAPLDKCALLGCAVMTGMGAVLNTARVVPGSRVAVFGAGGVGLNAIQGAAIAGAERIIAVDARPEKLERARAFGATDGIDASREDAVKAVRALTDGRGADYAFEVVGRKDTIEQALAATRRGGTCVVVGIASTRETVALNAFGIPFYEKRLLGCWYGGADVHADIPKLLALYGAGRLKLDELVTGTYRLADVNRAFGDMAAATTARGVIVF
jgi:S-(hydroxymethyl)glutathione dehydrogenase/alcohol dehydrogenase